MEVADRVRKIGRRGSVVSGSAVAGETSFCAIGFFETQTVWRQSSVLAESQVTVRKASGCGEQSSCRWSCRGLTSLDAEELGELEPCHGKAEDVRFDSGPLPWFPFATRVA